MSYPVVKFCDEATEKVWADVDVNAFDDKSNLLILKENYSTLLFHLLVFYCFEHKLFSIYPKNLRERLKLYEQRRYMASSFAQFEILGHEASHLYESLEGKRPIDIDDMIFSVKDRYRETNNYQKVVRPRLLFYLKDIRDLLALLA